MTNLNDLMDKLSALSGRLDTVDKVIADAKKEQSQIRKDVLDLWRKYAEERRAEISNATNE